MKIRRLCLSVIPFLSLFFALQLSAYQSLGTKPIETPEKKSSSGSSKKADRFQMSFKDADISSIISQLADLIGKTIIVPPNLKGKITIISPKDISKEEAIVVLEAMLGSMGYSMVEQQDFYTITVSGDPVKRGILPPISNSGTTYEDSLKFKDDISIFLIRPMYEEAKEMKAMLIPFSSKGGTIQSHDKSNSLIICDSQSYMERIREMITLFDVPQKNIKIQVIPLKHANVKSVLQYLNVLINNPLFKEQYSVRQRSRETKLLTEDRTNSLIVVGTETEIGIVQEILQTIDVKVDYDRELKIYELKYLDCATVAREIQGIFAKNLPANEIQHYEKKKEKTRTYIPDASIVISPLTICNSIVVVANKPTHKIISDILEQFDLDEDSRGLFRILSLQFADAEVITRDIDALFASKAQNPGISKLNIPKLVSNIRLNSVMVLAPNRMVLRQIEAMIREMDIKTPTERNTTHVYYLENADAKIVAEVLTKVADAGDKKNQTENDRIMIVSEESTNSLLIKCSQEKYESLVGIIRSLDIVKSQVMIEVLIAEVSMTNIENFGIEWGALNKDMGDQRVFAGSNYNLRSGALSNQGFTMGLLKRGEELDVAKVSTGDLAELSKIQGIINAHANDTNFNILSAPQILTTNNSEASISVGEVIPFPTDTVSTGSSSDLTRSSFKYEDVGIDLKVTPRINQKNYVTLQINQEIKTKSTESQSFGSSSFAIPIIGKRVANTNVTIKNAETIVIAGLISEENTVVVDKVPFLGDIPLLGKLFRKNRTEKKKKNLMVFITPHIISSLDEMNGYELYSKGELHKKRRNIQAHNINARKSFKKSLNPVTVKEKAFTSSPRVVIDFERFLQEEKKEKFSLPVNTESHQKDEKLAELRQILTKMKKTFKGIER